MKPTVLFCFCLLLLGSISPAQNDLFLISSAGMEFGNGDIQINFSLGEPIIETFRSDGQIYTQGFHQTFDLRTQVLDFGNSTLEVAFYPNPCDDILYVEFLKGVQTPAQPPLIEVYDLWGRLQETISFHADINGPIRIITTLWPAGVYFIHAHLEDGLQTQTAKIIKQ